MVVVLFLISNNINYYVFTTVVHKEQLNLVKELNKTEDYYYFKSNNLCLMQYKSTFYNEMK
jgi:hypothetical protein